MASEVNEDLASDVEQAERERAESAARGKSYDPTIRTLQCFECGDDLAVERSKLGARTCVECQEALERAAKRYRG